MAERNRAQYIVDEKAAFEKKREEFRKETMEKALEAYYQQAGYAKSGKEWVTAKSLLATAVAKERKRLDAELRKTITSDVYTARGYSQGERGAWTKD